MRPIRKSYRTWSYEDLAEAYRLCLVTDERWLGGRTLYSCVAEAVVGGVTFVNLRCIGMRTIDIVKRARDLASVCRVANVPLIIDDDIEAAKTAGVDGVHIYHSSLKCADARAELGPDAIIGVSTKSPEEACEAESAGASYICAGPVFASPANPEKDDELIGVAAVEKIASAVSIPVLAIGGINAGNVVDLSGTGAQGVAAVSAILAAPDIEEAAAALRLEVDAYLGGISQQPLPGF